MSYILSAGLALGTFVSLLGLVARTFFPPQTPHSVETIRERLDRLKPLRRRTILTANGTMTTEVFKDGDLLIRRRTFR